MKFLDFEFLRSFENVKCVQISQLLMNKIRKEFLLKMYHFSHIVWKLLKMSHLKFWILAFSTNFCTIKTDLSGNTVWPQASGFQKLAKMGHSN